MVVKKGETPRKAKATTSDHWKELGAFCFSPYLVLTFSIKSTSALLFALLFGNGRERERDAYVY